MMQERSVRLSPLRVSPGDLLLDPNNPRFGTNLNLAATVPDSEIPEAQQRIRDLFVATDFAADSRSEDEDSETQEGPVEIGDLVGKMKLIGFVAIDQIVVRKLRSKARRQQYVVIEGNRRVSAAKFLLESKPESDPDKQAHHDWVLQTLSELDVLLLDTDGLSQEDLDHQIGVILGLRHFGSVLPWGPLAKAVNIYNEYMTTDPAQSIFKLDSSRLTSVETRLSVPRSDVKSALKTYIAYRQLQEAFSQAPPKPSHYSLIQACVTNGRLETAGFITRDPNSFQLSADSVEKVNSVCEFKTRDEKKPGDKKNILAEDKSVSSLAGLVSDAVSNPDDAVKAFAASLRDQVLNKDQSLSDAVANLKTFKSDHAWTESLAKLLDKADELDVKDFQPKGNELQNLEKAQKAFTNVRKILGV